MWCEDYIAFIFTTTPRRRYMTRNKRQIREIEMTGVCVGYGTVRGKMLWTVQKILRDDCIQVATQSMQGRYSNSSLDCLLNKYIIANSPLLNTKLKSM